MLYKNIDNKLEVTKTETKETITTFTLEYLIEQKTKIIEQKAKEIIQRNKEIAELDEMITQASVLGIKLKIVNDQISIKN